MSVEQRSDVFSKLMDWLEALFVKMTLWRVDSVAKTEQMSLKIQRVPEQAEKAMKFNDRMSGLEASVRPNVSRGGK